MSVPQVPAVSAFDAMAERYDADFTHSPVGRTLRELVWDRLDPLFPVASRVLELGCGTGEDALHLSGRGVGVVATDASAQMVETARRKAAAVAAAGNPEFCVLSMEAVSTALAGQVFDGHFANFGAVNCVEDLSRLARGLAGLLKPGAPLLWVLIGKRVPWEWLWYGSRNQWRKAFRRYRDGGVEWRGLRIRYPVPTEVVQALVPFFTITRISPLGWALPPSYAAAWVNRSPRALSLLSRMERWGRAHPLLANWSDHYIIEARRAEH